MDVEDLRTFVEVADAGGVTPAARRLGVSKSIVSRRLVRLEAELGVQLLARTTRGAALTEAGVTFRDHAARVCDEIDVAKETILPAGELRGRLRISAPLSFGPTHFAPVIAEMGRLHPQLHINSSYSDRFVDLISEGFDCAIRVGNLQPSRLIAKRIGPMHGHLVASPDYIEAHGSPETPEELTRHQAVMQGTEAWRLMDGDQIVTVNPNGRFKADNGVALVSAAAAGLGVAALPECLVEEHLRTGALVRVMTRYPVAEAGIYVVRPPGLHPARKVRVLTELLTAYFGQPPHLAQEVATSTTARSHISTTRTQRRSKI
ncbi:LysR family transcriptional regulator [Hansschlegelia sp. KR7-227]|uniref:LysR family transcriptional regulator n=1 Tax=Hansschlegelia sp. KR7-227 TaxID=3400914 RepID=UPI003C086A22